MKVKVLVSPKIGVLDPQAKTVFHSLHSHGFDHLEDVKMSKEIILEFSGIDEKRAIESAKQMCEALLVNPVIEDYSIEISL